MLVQSTRVLAVIFGFLVLVGAACSADDRTVTAHDGLTTTSAQSDDASDQSHDEADQTSSVDEETTIHSASEDETGNDTAVDHTGEAGTNETPAVGSLPGTDGDVDFVIPAEMNEWGYVITESSIPVGSTVRFEFVNVGVVEHEAMFGTMHQQQEFADDGHGDHGEADHHGTIDAITLDPGETGSLVVEFDEAGEILVGCHLPGHWEAGMVTTLIIV